MKRTTIYTDENVMNYLSSLDISISSEARKFFKQLAEERGYRTDINSEIDRLEKQLRKLRGLQRELRKEDALRWSFGASFKGYLSTGGKDMGAIRAWLTSPACLPYRAIIGKPKALTKGRVQELIAEAVSIEAIE